MLNSILLPTMLSLCTAHSCNLGFQLGLVVLHPSPVMGVCSYLYTFIFNDEFIDTCLISSCNQHKHGQQSFVYIFSNSITLTFPQNVTRYYWVSKFVPHPCWKKIRYTTYIRVFEKYHMRLHVSVTNLR